ncbi:hypothetical protein IHN63_00340 [Deinococcus sp. 6YEL10]|uniref:dCTP deaminase domain-containing protein n=1 Tax=Deinococcus sp. 6YEL10 TaxID=2745870 RepID=UPI001E42D383|nr:hypothetical protein [Deinococcus sp. 6YEL10]MCD0159747.1 hypothetical protein [Deinococcus sp. 6YEL10]
MILNDTLIEDAIRQGTILLQPGNPHNHELVRPNSLDTTVGPVALIEIPEELRAFGHGDSINPNAPEWARDWLGMSSILGFHSDKHGNDYLKVKLPGQNDHETLLIEPGQRVIITSNERLKGVLTGTTAQAVLRSGAAHAGWSLAGGFAESGFGSDPEGYAREAAFREVGSEAAWVNRPEWEGVVFSFALTNLSRNPRELRYQDRLVQLVFSEAYQPDAPYHVRESSSYKAQRRVEDRVL